MSFLLIADDNFVRRVESLDASDVKDADNGDVLVINIDDMKVYGTDGTWHHIDRFQV